MPLQVMDLTELSTSKSLPVFLRSKPPPPFKLPEKSPWTLPPDSSCHPMGNIARQRLLGNDNTSHCRQDRTQRWPVPDSAPAMTMAGRRAQRIGIAAIHLAQNKQAAVLENKYEQERAKRVDAQLSGALEPRREFMHLREHANKKSTADDGLFVKSMFAPEVPQWPTTSTPNSFHIAGSSGGAKSATTLTLSASLFGNNRNNSQQLQKTPASAAINNNTELIVEGSGVTA